MSTIIKAKRSAVPGKVPLVTDLDLGELAINTYDGKMFFKQSNGSNAIVQVATTSLDLGDFASTTSSRLNDVISDNTGSGSLVFSVSPSLVSPTITGNTNFSNGALFVDSNTNNIGVGTITPTAKLHVSGDIRINGGIIDSNGSKGTNGQILTTNGTSVEWTTNLGSGGLASASQSIIRDSFTGNSAATSYNLSATPLGAEFVLVTINGIIQDAPDYSVTGSSLTFDEPLANTDVVEARIFQPYNPHFVDVSAIYANTSPNQILDSFDANLYKTVKYMIQIANTSTYQSSEMLLVHDGSQVYSTEYAQLNTGAPLASIDSAIEGGFIKIKITPYVSNITAKAIRYAHA